MQKSQRIKIFATLLLLIVTIFAIVQIGGDKQMSNEELSKLADYNSEFYDEVTAKELGMTYNEVLNKYDVDKQDRLLHEFKFYKLNYKNLNEFHIVGQTEGVSCRNKAVVNYSDFETATFLLFQNSEPEVEHECNGDPCTSCSFTRNSEGEITGCNLCESPTSGICNHKITSGG
ncbi:MAG: hypothetical protein HUJ22_03075 [Gracilimonas sp.]|uniref:hypothetical protein n=1 Tax=Gracilimonas sp. TaxID=1974203 RepID=UPI0019A1E659|nr:hypothetical protein [Gracilimonas sp.]MBD3615529.1 hypothetical protein [Gracilimonas sp.]